MKPGAKAALPTVPRGDRAGVCGPGAAGAAAPLAPALHRRGSCPPAEGVEANAPTRPGLGRRGSPLKASIYPRQIAVEREVKHPPASRPRARGCPGLRIGFDRKGPTANSRGLTSGFPSWPPCADDMSVMVRRQGFSRCALARKRSPHGRGRRNRRSSGAGSAHGPIPAFLTSRRRRYR